MTLFDGDKYELGDSVSKQDAKLDELRKRIKFLEESNAFYQKRYADCQKLNGELGARVRELSQDKERLGRALDAVLDTL